MGDKSPWHWLLLLPVVVPLITPLYNFDKPWIGGIPAFYWLQFAFVVGGAVITIAVYRLTRRVGGDDDVA
ncbi:DUF3311 domain-containing protein [Actinoplanes sp. CA-054009]